MVGSQVSESASIDDLVLAPKDVPEFFVDWLNGHLEAIAKSYTISAQDAFPIWCLTYYHDVEIDEAVDACDTCNSSGVSGDGGLDGWHYDHEGKAFYLMQAKLAEKPQQRVFGAGDHLRDLTTVARRLLEAPLGDLPEKLEIVAEELRQARADEADIVLEYFLGGGISKIMKVEIAELAHAGEMGLQIETLPDIYNQYVARETTDDLKGRSLSVAMSGATSVRPIVLPEGIADAITVNLDLHSLGHSARPLGRRLFSANVRYELGRTNLFNRGMRSTLEAEPGAFSFYNNGITIVCEGFEKRPVGEGYELLIENPQVVNGCQTVSALVASRNSLIEGAGEVQARVIAMESGSDGRQRAAMIAQYTNSQSPVNPADLRAGTSLQSEIQARFALLAEPVFYERKRGEWLSMSKRQKAKFSGRRCTMVDVGQRYRAWLGQPAASVAKKSEIFTDDAVHAQMYRRSIDPRTYLLAYDLFQFFDGLLAPASEAHLISIQGGLQGESAPSRLRQARKAIAAHATALSRLLLIAKYGELSPGDCGELRLRLSDEKVQGSIGWAVFACVQDYATANPAPANLKSSLQTDAALQSMSASLGKYLSGPGGVLGSLPALS